MFPAPPLLEQPVTKRSLWRLISTLVICGVCAFFFIPLSKVRLGLDLKGGVHFELEVQSHEALEADLRDTADRLQDRLKEKGLAAASVRVDGLSIRIEGLAADQKAVVEKVTGTFGGYDATFDDQGARMIQRPAYQKILKEDASKRALLIIENRVNQFGVAEPEITASGADGNRIVVELPGVGEAERERIKNLLSTPGRLEQRLKAKQDPTSYKGFPTREAALAFLGGQLPPNTELLPELESERDLRRAGKEVVVKGKAEEKIKSWHLVETKVYVDGGDITDAHRAVNQTTDANEINFTLNRKGADDFATLTGISSEENRLISIVLDRKVVSNLSCREKIPGGSVRVSGSFTKDEADDFALKLKSGAMRASMKFLEEKSMGPSLGADSIHSGVRAALLGFGVIVIFMLIYYRWSGLNAIVALTVNLVVMLGLLGSFNAVLTLPGIAGFALTLGMAVDANILIFERIREELKNGKSVPGAIQAGFDRVFWTIVDSHVTQLFAAMLLFIFGTGPVKGFAVTLTVGVVASLFTSIYISRFIYDWILERHPGTKTLSV
jgi:preprotein translocase subunit SecD